MLVLCTGKYFHPQLPLSEAEDPVPMLCAQSRRDSLLKAVGTVCRSQEGNLVLPVLQFYVSMARTCFHP